MSILSRMKTVLKSKANSTTDRSSHGASDPAKELDRAIRELEDTHQAAVKELLGYKTSAVRMERDLERLDQERSMWERRAQVAVKKGNDDLAKKCLREVKRHEADRAAVQRDRDEVRGYAAELNESRKKAETQLKMLKLRKGTMAAQIASARSGGSSIFGREEELFGRLDSAEGRIDEGVLAAEVDAEMAGEELGAAAAARDLGEAAAEPDTDTALAELKARMAAEKARG